MQASQLIIDCVQSYLIQHNLKIQQLVFLKDKKLSLFYLEEIKLSLFKILFELAIRRYQQLKKSLSTVENGDTFFSLDFDEKSLLYLKEKAQLNLEKIELITSYSKVEILSHLYSARIKMIPKMNDVFFQESSSRENGVEA